MLTLQVYDSSSSLNGDEKIVSLVQNNSMKFLVIFVISHKMSSHLATANVYTFAVWSK